MTLEFVVDADVWSHSDNATVDEFESAQSFVHSLRKSDVQLAFDEGASIEESQNTSLFISQFMALGLRGSVAFQVLSACFREGRVNEYSKTVDAASGRYISQRVPNKQDRAYVRVAINSDCDALVSHDHTDFPERVRKDFARRFSVSVLTASQALDL